MGSKSTASLGLFLIINLLFSTLTAACGSGCGGNQHPNPTPTTPRPSGTCTVNLGVCLDLLHAINLKVGDPPVEPCCSLINGLLDLEAALCLCTTLKANVLGIINLNIPISLELLLNVCKRKIPNRFRCPY